MLYIMQEGFILKILKFCTQYFHILAHWLYAKTFTYLGTNFNVSSIIEVVKMITSQDKNQSRSKSTNNQSIYRGKRHYIQENSANIHDNRTNFFIQLKPINKSDYALCSSHGKANITMEPIIYFIVVISL